MRKTAEELRLSQEDYDALLKVREMLDTECIVYRTICDFVFTDDPILVTEERAKAMPRFFNMSTGGLVHSCGTVACIGGWMDVVSHTRPVNEPYSTFGRSVLQRYGQSHPIRDLFYPDIDVRRVGWDDIDNKTAVKAIDNFLEHGKPMYNELLREKEGIA